MEGTYGRVYQVGIAEPPLVFRFSFGSGGHWPVNPLSFSEVLDPDPSLEDHNAELCNKKCVTFFDFLYKSKVSFREEKI
jgi:hypothetical protein